MVIQPLSTRLIKPNFCFDLSHRRSTTVSLETSVAKAMKVLRKLRCLQIEVGIAQSLCRNDCHQVILLGQVLEIVE